VVRLRHGSSVRSLAGLLLQSAAVGLSAGAFGALFFGAIELAQRALLERWTGYVPLRAAGEAIVAWQSGVSLRTWLLAIFPAVGGLVSGLLTSRFAPEAAGGGGDAIIRCYHAGAAPAARVLPVKVAASLAALGTGGSGGRAGPTMQVGGLLGALLGRAAGADERRLRLLVVAGIAAGLAGLFRTPLGAALVATEILYRDGFALDALLPALVASLASYAVVLGIYGAAPLFGPSLGLAFAPAHLWLHALLALVVAAGGALFLRLLRGVQEAAAASPLPAWLRPAAGGLAMGVLGVVLVEVVTRRFGVAASRLGVFGGGRGAAQAAIEQSADLPAGWTLVVLLAAIFAAKAVATSLTVGSGAAAGDFAPSLVMGALLGGAFGHAAQAALGDPGLDPTAFAFVGMATFYGCVAHAPVGALVLVSELAGTPALLLPMAIAGVVSAVALRSPTLYPAQRTRSESRHTPISTAPGSR
jgi:CIC family chloride channel protein